MEIKIVDYALWKFPAARTENICWIWFSKRFNSVFFSLEGEIAIYNETQRQWSYISLEEYACDIQCAEALTTTASHLIFAGFAGDFEVYEYPSLRYIKSLDTENSGYGAASYKNYVFINNHDPFGIKMVEVPSGEVLREFSIANIIDEENFLLNSINCTDKFLIGYFENISNADDKDEIDTNHYYLIWNFLDGSFISKIPTESEVYEDPYITNGNLIDFSKIYSLKTSEMVYELPVSEREYILTVLNEYIITYCESEVKTHELRIYKKNRKGHKTLTFHADDFHTLKNTGEYILILKDQFYYFINLKHIIEIFKENT